MFHHSTFMISLTTFSLYLLLSLLPTTTTSLPTIGVTYSSTTRQDSPPPPSPDRITTAMQNLKLTHLRLEEPDPSIIRSLLYTNISLFLTIPNYLVTPIATNRSIARAWIYTHVLPFYPRAKITTISVGNAFTDVYPESINNLLPAISNVHISLRDLGIRKISVSTSFSFVTAVTSPFPPSSAAFQEIPGVNLIGPLLQFLSDTNSSFLINLYPYNLYRLRPEIPLGIALFQEHPFNFRDDFTTGVRYKNLFDIMVDAVVSAMALEGYETIPVIVTETGWPSSGSELDANSAYAEIYLKGLVKHLKSGAGTPLLKDGVKGVYLYELFDKEGAGNGRNWGILYPNGSTKYDKIDFSSGWKRLVNVGFILLLIVLQIGL
ncbi:putative glucan endo-1,3-beta-D-glucosidase [Medicago truncatula]|uniref:glucan endo-1,3-beta-D-glucosidase n=1 Tax=Medicago truncatula TaxID=3880 RepID=A0A396HUN3_MEDTR|nr:putative glucan endo-1,3-beta-D-glucosidase [Medicago truncatula]